MKDGNMNYVVPSKRLRFGVVAVYAVMLLANVENAKFYDFVEFGIFILMMVNFDKIAKWILSKFE
jgi:hypothetical protein